jgi:UDP-N-acetylmuramate dehydrogenase
MAEIRSAREASQPVRARTGGSTFRNPPPEVSSLKAWELIDAAGCRGLGRGGAIVSEKHCNFLINTGGASAADLEGLGEEVRRRVFAASGVTLDWEILCIGVPARGPEVVTWASSAHLSREEPERWTPGAGSPCCTAAFPPNARSAWPPAPR